MSLLIAISTFVLVFGFIFGLLKLREFRVEQWKSSAMESCQQIAKLSGSKEARIGDNYSCLLVKDGKIIEIKDW